MKATARKFTATAWRFQDPTGALAGLRVAAPPECQAVRLAKLAVETDTVTLLAHGNYVLVL